MGELIYLPGARLRELEAAYALKDFEHFLDLCREIELRGGRLTRERRLWTYERLDSELILDLESLLRTLCRPS